MEASWRVPIRLKFPSRVVFSHFFNAIEETKMRRSECGLLGCTEIFNEDEEDED